jgi:pimeloyl-ACP methyl ester carboxylesterase
MLNPLLNHKIYGKGNPGSPLLILHGLFGMLDNWTRIAKKIAESFEVHTLDLRNHGRSFHSEEMNYSYMADDVLDYMDRQGLDKVSLLGHSMGGKVALKVAVTYPFVIDKLIVADMAMRSYPVRHGHILQALNKVDWQAADSRQDLEKQLKAKLPMDASVIHFLLKSAFRNATADGYALRFNLSAITKHIADLGQGITTDKAMHFPTLFIRGIHSDYVTESDLSIAEGHFTNFKHVDLKAGHWLHAQLPEPFTLEVENFLK